MPAPLAVGDPAPDFRLPTHDGREVSLASFAGRKLVIYFYPRADTPGCTRESQAFTRLKDAFAAAGAELLGVSADPLDAQARFAQKYRLSVPLASDESRAMIEAYGAWGEKKLYGRTYLGLNRMTYLIDPEGKIARVWRSVKVDGHAEAVLKAVETL